MNWLIVGGTGQLGLALIHELNGRRISYSSVNSKELDISDSLAVDEFIQLLKPEVIINAAAWTDVDSAETNQVRAFEVNSQGALNLAVAAKNLNAIFVQISTDFVFSGASIEPWSEYSPHNPISVYGATKSQGEVLVGNEYLERSYIVRTAWLYSANRKNFAKTMIKLALLDNHEVRVVNDQIGQPTFAGDLAKQIVDMIISKLPFGVYHATNSGQVSWFDFSREIFKLVGADMNRVTPISSLDLQRPAKRPSYSVLGHHAWSGTGVSPMQNWENALAYSLPMIISSVKLEGLSYENNTTKY
jgi:dTDP-4-dehydrorhamnose reductase